MATKRSDVLTAITETAVSSAMVEGLERARAERVGRLICEHIQRDFGTTRVYIPAANRDARDRAILAGLAQGDTPTAIARRVGVSKSTVYRLKRRQPRGLAPDDWVL